MIVGTAGHIDHGKTSLVKALTGVDTDRLKEEKARGITLDLGYAYSPLSNNDVLGFVDVPGHEKLVRTMVAGATGIDFVLLVIAADDGPMPQTREHLAILALLGLNRGAVALTKVDRVDPERLVAAEAEIRRLLAGTALATAPVFRVSPVTGEGIPSLRSHLDAVAASTRQGRPSGHFRLAVDRCFTLAGTGTVVTGTVHAGEVRAGDRLLLSPQGLEVRVRSIHAQNRPAETGLAGQRCALNLAGPHLERSDIGRGDWIVDPIIHAPIQRLDAELRLLPTETRTFRHWTPVHFHLGASDISGRIALLEGDSLEPGSAMLVQAVLDQPICALAGDRFVIRDQSATRTLGGGKVIDIFPPARYRRTPERRAALKALGRPDPSEALTEILALSPAGVDLQRFCINRNLRDDEAAPLGLETLRVVEGGGERIGFAGTQWDALKQTVREKLARFHEQEPDSQGPDRERLRRIAAPGLNTPIFAALVEEMLQDAVIVKSGPWLHLPEHQVTLSPSETALWERIIPMLDDQPFEPPRVRDIARSLALEEGQVRLLLKRVAARGEAYRVAHDHYFTPNAVADLARILRATAEAEGAVRAAAFRDHIGTGRKLAIQILEFFDRIGVTRRVGDAHRLRQTAAGDHGQGMPGL